MRTLGVIVLSLAIAGSAGSAWGLYSDYFPAVADGSFNAYGGAGAEGYGIGGAGIAVVSKTTQYYGFMSFSGSPGDTSTEALETWLVNKKIVRTSVYLRDATNNFCTALAAPGTYLNDPVTLLGLRAANAGHFVDRGVTAKEFAGSGGSYSAPLVEGGENAAPAWRMGPSPYAQIGDAGAGAEWWKLSSHDSQHPGEEINATKAFFDPEADGFGGYNGPYGSGRFALRYLVTTSDAHIQNSQKLDSADCTGNFGGEEPRNKANDGNAGFGWYAVALDRMLVSGLINDPEVKGLVFSSVAVTTSLNTRYYGRDQGGTSGPFAPYLAITATLSGDSNNDGSVNIFDLLELAAAWNSASGDATYNEECDFNLSGSVNIFDLLTLAGNWNTSIP